MQSDQVCRPLYFSCPWVAVCPGFADLENCLRFCGLARLKGLLGKILGRSGAQASSAAYTPGKSMANGPGLPALGRAEGGPPSVG